jgi:hypothetical protein
MRIDDCYALLDVSPGASEEEVKRAYRVMTKVWHPDRFANDAALREKAEQKLKQINEAYEAIVASRGRGEWQSRTTADDPPRTTTARSPEAVRREHLLRARTWALACTGLAVFFLLRRPTPVGLVMALLLFCAAIAFVRHMRGR